jgi:hypothetical protein
MKVVPKRGEVGWGIIKRLRKPAAEEIRANEYPWRTSEIAFE